MSDMSKFVALYEAYQRSLQIDQARHSLLAYSKLMMPEFMAPAHVRAIADALERVERGEIRRLIIAMPPRHGKTNLVSELFPTWYFGRNPRKEIIFASYNQDIADDRGRVIRNRMTDPLYSQVFPDCKVSADSASARRFSTTQGGNYFGAGVGGPMTGRGGHIVVIDDPHKNREEVESAGQRQALHDWYDSVAFTRLAPMGAIVIVATRWHVDDLTGYVLRTKPHENWVVLSLPAILDEKAADFIGATPGGALWPERYPIDVLEEYKRSMPPRDWASLYMQSPFIEGGNIIKRPQIKEWDRPKPPECNLILASFDTAFSAKDTADFSACTVWGTFDDEQTNEQNVILLEAKQKRVEFPELRRWIIDVYERHKPDMVLIENKASGQSLLQELRRMSVPVVPFNPGRVDKVSRLHSITPLFENGKVWAPMQKEWAQEWAEQLTTFPASKHDDLVDATSSALLRLRKVGELTADLDYRAPVDEDADERVSTISYW